MLGHGGQKRSTKLVGLKEPVQCCAKHRAVTDPVDHCAWIVRCAVEYHERIATICTNPTMMNLITVHPVTMGNAVALHRCLVSLKHGVDR